MNTQQVIITTLKKYFQVSCLIEAYDSFQSSQQRFATFFVIVDHQEKIEIKDFKDLDCVVSEGEKVS